MKKLPASKTVKVQEKSGSVNYVITKFLRKGFNGLTMEDLAVTMITPDFSAAFKNKTGQNWDTQYKSKVIDRLEKAKFDLRWYTKHTTINGEFGPLFELCRLGSSGKVMEYIKNKGKEALLAVDVAVKTPLHIACSNGHTQLAETLIKMGSPVDPQDKFLRTPLLLAASSGHETVANALLSFGAKIQIKDSVFFLYLR